MRRRGIVRAGRPGLMGTVARTAVVAGTATVTAGAISSRQQRRAQGSRRRRRIRPSWRR